MSQGKSSQIALRNFVGQQYLSVRCTLASTIGSQFVTVLLSYLVTNIFKSYKKYTPIALFYNSSFGSPWHISFISKT